jgi:hypothetical protein
MKFVLALAGSIVVAATVAAQADATPRVAACNVVNTPAQLQAINKNANTLAGTYCLGKDIDMSGVADFKPIGAIPTAFTGQFYGNGHVIKNLKISGSTSGMYGLFGAVLGGVIQDVGLVNVDVSIAAGNSYVGALASYVTAMDSPIFISNVYSTGNVSCKGSSCASGGLFGILGGNVTMSDAWSSADVTTNFIAGGLAAGVLGGPSTFQRIYATGNVTGGAVTHEVGGLFGEVTGTTTTTTFLVQAYATGKVTGGANATVGGLIAVLEKGYLQDAYATGPVTGGASATVGGLVGSQVGGVVRQAFAVGPVTGGNTKGGLVGAVSGSPGNTAVYWDQTTSGVMTSASGTGKTTAQLRAALPAGFKLGWGINKTLSYPYLSDPTNFSSTLATLVVANKPFVFLPIQQSDKSQYLANPTHPGAASLATVYTMVGRAVGITDNVAQLKDVKIDKYYWHDATQTTTFTGPITAHANLGAMVNVPAATPLTANVITQMNAHRLVILRGTYSKSGGGTATHYMLGTLYTKNPNSSVKTIVANDPYTGKQVEISPTTKRVLTPRFPLAGFKVDGYQAIAGLN